MVWYIVGAAVVVVVLGLVVMARRRGRNSGAAGSRDAQQANGAHPGAHAYQSQHESNLNGGLPF